MKISLVDDGDAAAWNQAVDELPGATFYHQFEWREVVKRHFRFTPRYLMAIDSTGIVGLLPLFIVRRLLQPSVLLSMPLGVYGGAVGSGPEVINLLVEAAIAEAEKLSVGYLELRNESPLVGEWLTDTGNATFRQPLAATADEQLLTIPRKQRAEVRKAQGIDLQVKFSRSIEPFYSAYATSMRNLGSPMFRRNYYRSLVEVFAQQCDLLTVYQRDQPLASVLNFYFKDQVLPFYGGGYPAARPTNAFPFLYWELMRAGIQRGYRVFDFGRSREGSGAYSFKKNFGFRPEPLHYQRKLLSAQLVPDINPDNPSLQRLISIWQRLPVALTRRVGPWVATATV